MPPTSARSRAQSPSSERSAATKRAPYRSCGRRRDTRTMSHSGSAAKRFVVATPTRPDAPAISTVLRIPDCACLLEDLAALGLGGNDRRDEDDAVENRLQPVVRAEQVQPMEADGQEEEGHELSRHIEIARPIGCHAQKRRRVAGSRSSGPNCGLAPPLWPNSNSDATPTRRPAKARTR